MESYAAPLSGGLAYAILNAQGAGPNNSAGSKPNAITIAKPLENGGGLLLQVEVAANSSGVHLLSLAGGGIKAMTADAGLLAGLLKYFSKNGDPTTIGDLLSNTTAISANSGSSWFTNLLGYSQEFVNSLQDYDKFF